MCQAGHLDEKPSVSVESRQRKTGPTHCCAMVSVKRETRESTRTSQVTVEKQPADLCCPLRDCQSKNNRAIVFHTFLRNSIWR